MKIVLEIVRIVTSSQVFVSGSNLYTGGIFVDGFSNLYTGGIFVDGSLKNTPLHRSSPGLGVFGLIAILEHSPFISPNKFKFET
ncbi:hypothetical protein TNCV_883971 [Trichonephila clavipes]|nr:hypothetical protein TNCV_883971 [Trichonephila clavipes]